RCADNSRNAARHHLGTLRAIKSERCARSHRNPQAAKHGVHHTMIASWKRQAIAGMTGTFSGAGEAARAASEAEVDKLHAKIGQLLVERDLYEGRFVKEGAIRR